MVLYVEYTASIMIHKIYGNKAFKVKTLIPLKGGLETNPISTWCQGASCSYPQSTQHSAAKAGRAAGSRNSWSRVSWALGLNWVCSHLGEWSGRHVACDICCIWHGIRNVLYLCSNSFPTTHRICRPGTATSIWSQPHKYLRLQGFGQLYFFRIYICYFIHLAGVLCKWRTSCKSTESMGASPARMSRVVPVWI